MNPMDLLNSEGDGNDGGNDTASYPKTGGMRKPGQARGDGEGDDGGNDTASHPKTGGMRKPGIAAAGGSEG